MTFRQSGDLEWFEHLRWDVHFHWFGHLAQLQDFGSLVIWDGLDI